MSIYLGDCLNIIQDMESSSIDLIYLDPPFFTQKSQYLKTRDNTKEYSFDDTWSSVHEYIDFMRQRLIECRRILKQTGSIFLHCDKSASHHLRVLLDELFGEDNFQSEIIWSYKRWSNSKKGLMCGHQTIYFYSRSHDFKFNTIYTEYSETTNIDQILQLRERNEYGKSIYKRDCDGEIILAQQKRGVPLSDVWEIPYLNPKAAERTGYPTQKPILLLEQIIKLVTDEGDLVLDPFCGSGTALVSAKLLNRRFAGIDISKDAVELAKKRLANPVKTNSALLTEGKNSYINKTNDELSILKALDAIPVQRNKGIDGFLKVNYSGGPVSIKIQRETENIIDSLNLLIKSSKTKKCTLMILVRTNPNEALHVDSLPDNILLIDRYDVILQQWLVSQNSKKQKTG
ncbi:site-specific DNA-methyltransferase (adenine-specific) [Anaerobacterium chartisolvens]|uniref:Methyltransferase n=1 Tax=Anaerobacterium chartisolvens TaxID=1297424 RepID=A0A369B9L0_9FIRM|nr:site-specific DNA-methyltransferase [Anaerobacterium chartisolvens]RCX17246.1 site-specific DNA-methyltransferase (adenine-specific) [Anaerobacterium chartisolvens]